MAWVKTLPDGDKAATSLDDDIRTNNDAIEAALSAEHTFSTGGNQDCRHKFMVDTNATILGTAAFVEGAIAISSDEIASDYVLRYFADGNWIHALEPYLSNPNDWASGQHCTPKALTSGANVPSSWSDSNIFTLTLAHNAEIDNPTNQPAAKSGVWYYIVTQGAGTAYTLTFGTHFANPEPMVDPVLGSVSVFQCTLLSASTVGGIKIERTGWVPLASDAEASTGTETTKAVTPANLKSTGGNATAGYIEVVGSGKLMQWTSGVIANGDFLDFNVAFNDVAYTPVATGSSISLGAVVVVRVNASRVQLGFSGGAMLVHVVAFGDKIP